MDREKYQCIKYPVIYRIINHTGASRRVKVRGKSCWGILCCFFTLGVVPRDGAVTHSAATSATNSFLLCTFLKVIVRANFDFFFFLWEAWEQSQKYHYTESDIRRERPSDREQWRSSLISELPRRDKGPLKSQETEQYKSRCTFQEKQRTTETQHDPGHCCDWTSDDSFSWASAESY